MMYFENTLLALVTQDWSPSCTSLMTTAHYLRFLPVVGITGCVTQ